MSDLISRNALIKELKEYAERLEWTSGSNASNVVIECIKTVKNQKSVKGNNDISYTSLEDEMLARSHRRNIGGEQWGL